MFGLERSLQELVAVLTPLIERTTELVEQKIKTGEVAYQIATVTLEIQEQALKELGGS